MSVHKIGDLAGTGKALRGAEIIAAVKYHLEIYQRLIESGTGSGLIPGMQRIVGTINGGSLPLGQMLKLVTQEGHTADFFVKDSYGEIVMSGPLLKSNGEPVTF